MRVLVTGAAGQLGGDLLPALAAAGHQSVGVDRTEGDMARDGVAAQLLQRHRPDAVVNCAAYNAVDRAEAEPEAALRVNAHAPDLLAQACSAAGVLMCHLSTDFVFDGQSDRPYDETDVPRPLSIYARSKRAGEEAVLSRLHGAVVVRTAWLFGRTGPNFILSVLRHALDGGALKVVGDEWGSPTWTFHLAPALVRLIDRARTGDVAGIVHLVNSGEASRWEQARAAVDAAGLGYIPIERTSAADLQGAAPRPRRSTLDTRVWRELGEPPLPAWHAAVEGYVASLRRTPEFAAAIPGSAQSGG